LPLSSYTGVYLIEGHNFAIRVHVDTDGTGLVVSVRGSSLTTYNLLPRDGDTFYWRIDREEEMCVKGMIPVPIAVTQLMHFAVSGNRVDNLQWRHEMFWKEPEIFRKADHRKLGRL
jgi:hypothetical protein